MGQRLNIWDFDDTLAWSVRAVEEFKRKYPEVENFRWWHDEDWSTRAVLETMPVIEMWERLNKTPGTHWVLSGRNRGAIVEWMRLWKQHPDLGPIIRKIERLHSTSSGPFGHKDTHIRKLQWVRDEAVGNWSEIHVYDDSARNLQELEKLGLNTHLIRDGREVYQGDHYLWTRSASATTVDRDLQVIYQSLKTLGELEYLSEEATYSEIFRATLQTLRKLQSSILKGLSTFEILELVEHQLIQSHIGLLGDLSSVADQVDGGESVEVEFSFDDLSTRFYRHGVDEVNREVHSLRVRVEATFDRLNLPLVCTIDSVVYDKNNAPIGFLGTIRRIS